MVYFWYLFCEKYHESKILWRVLDFHQDNSFLLYTAVGPKLLFWEINVKRNSLARNNFNSCRSIFQKLVILIKNSLDYLHQFCFSLSTAVNEGWCSLLLSKIVDICNYWWDSKLRTNEFKENEIYPCLYLLSFWWTE